MEKQVQKKALKIKIETPYQKLAKKYDVNVEYVGKIARAERKAVRGKALKIRKELELLASGN